MTDADGTNRGFTWDDTEAAQDRDAADLPLWRKIQWLEDMHRMGLRLEEARRKRIGGAAAEPDPAASDSDPPEQP